MKKTTSYSNKYLNILKKTFASFFTFLSMLATAQVPNANLALNPSTSGLYKQSIYWINWDLNNDNQPWDNLKGTVTGGIGAGVTQTFTSPMGIIYTLTLSNIKVYDNAANDITADANGLCVSATSNTYFLNNFPSGYDFLGVDVTQRNAKRIIGISNKNESLAAGSSGDGNRVTFTLTVSAQ